MNQKNIKLLLLAASIVVFIFACITSVITINYYNRQMQCLYNNAIYKNGAKFASTDGCNSCVCNNGTVACTLKACLNQQNSKIPMKGLEVYCYKQNDTLVYSLLPGTNRLKTYDEVTGESESLSSTVNYYTNKSSEEIKDLLINQYSYSESDALSVIGACSPTEILR